MGPCAKKHRPFGRSEQLGQPIQGHIPARAACPALEYLLQGQATVPDDLGIFLPRTWRLHPDICRSFREPSTRIGWIASHTRSNRELVGEMPEWLHRPAGLVYVPVEHEGNVYESAEEADRIAGLVADLLRARFARPLCGKEVDCRRHLIVAPYNLQVRRLERRLPGIRVGSVDQVPGTRGCCRHFSMCASTGDSSPRGVEFLFNRNRLNVAISRPRRWAIVVGNPALVRTNCTTIEQMRLVNVYCRAVQEGAPVS